MPRRHRLPRSFRARGVDRRTGGEVAEVALPRGELAPRIAGPASRCRPGGPHAATTRRSGQGRSAPSVHSASGRPAGNGCSPPTCRSRRAPPHAAGCCARRQPARQRVPLPRARGRRRATAARRRSRPCASSGESMALRRLPMGSPYRAGRPRIGMILLVFRMACCAPVFCSNRLLLSGAFSWRFAARASLALPLPDPPCRRGRGLCRRRGPF